MCLNSHCERAFVQFFTSIIIGHSLMTISHMSIWFMFIEINNTYECLIYGYAKKIFEPKANKN